MGNETEGKNWDVIGHQQIVDALKRHISTGKVNHAYLFVGPQSVGKKKVATEFAKALFCTAMEKPCGNCAECKKVTTGKHSDFKLVQEIKGKIGIPQVRTMQHDLSLKSYGGGYQVCIIDGVDHFTLPAANAILKILEEPVGKVVFVLLAENLEGVIPTIISRAVVLNFNLVPRSEIEDGLGSPGQKIIARASFGRPGLAVRYSTKPEELVDRNERQQELLGVIDQDFNQAFQLINSWKVKSEQAQEFVEVMTSYFRDLAVGKVGCDSLLLDKETTNEVYQKHLHNFSGRQIENVLNYLVKAKELLKHNVNPKLIVENFIIMLHHDKA